MNKITPQPVYLIVEAPESFQRTSEFVLEEAGTVTHFLERWEGMVVMTKEEFEKYVGYAFQEGRISFAFEIGDELEPIEQVYKNKTEFINSLFKPD